jgi:pimeloyl-ACP methyl ester carboxylesterase
LTAGLSCCAPQRAANALDLIRDIAAGDGESPLKRETTDPVRLSVAYSVGGRSYVGDIYWPSDGAPKAAAVFVPGVVKDGKDDRRLVAFAKSFARLGFLVLVPEIANLRSLVVSASDSQVIADAVRHLVEAGHLTEKKSVGLFAFSYAAGPALIAAMEPDTRDRVRFVYAVGPYYSVEAVVTYFTTGCYRAHPEDPWSSGTPSPYARWVFLRSNAGKVVDPADRAALIAMAERKLANADADISGLAKDLGGEGQSVLSLLANEDPERVRALIAQLPAPIRSEMRALDLSLRDLSSLKARLVIIHGRTDPMIPFTEGAALAQAAQHAADLYILDSLSHVELEFSGLWDFYKLWRVAYVILAERDGMPAPRYAMPSAPGQPTSDTGVR